MLSGARPLQVMRERTPMAPPEGLEWLWLFRPVRAGQAWDVLLPGALPRKNDSRERQALKVRNKGDLPHCLPFEFPDTRCSLLALVAGRLWSQA